MSIHNALHTSFIVPNAIGTPIDLVLPPLDTISEHSRGQTCASFVGWLAVEIYRHSETAVVVLLALRFESCGDRWVKQGNLSLPYRRTAENSFKFFVILASGLEQLFYPGSEQAGFVILIPAV